MQSKTLHILVIAYGPIDLNTGYKHRVMQLSEELAAQGHDITLLWFYQIQRIFKKLNIHYLDPKLRVITFPTFPLFFSRILSLLGRMICVIVTRYVAFKYHFDAIQAEAPLCATFGASIKSPFFVVDYHGDTVSEKKMNLNAAWKIEWAVRDEAVAAKLANAFIAVSEPLQIKIAERYDNKQGIMSVVAPCGVDLNRFTSNMKEYAKIRSELGIEDRIVFCYLGGLQKWQNIYETIDLVAQLRQLEQRIFFLLLTQDNIQSLKEKLATLGSPDIDYICLSLTPDDVPRILPAADIGMLLRSYNPVNLVSSPTKCGEYLGAGVPVLATEHAGDAVNIIRKGQCGFLLKDMFWTANEINEVLRFACNVVSNRRSWVDRCQQVAGRYQSWEVTRQSLRKLYCSLRPLETRVHS